MTDPLVESKTAEAANAAAVHQQAVEESRAAQLDDAVDRGLEKFFNRNVESGRFIPLKNNRMADVERFQFICDQIDSMHTRLESMEGYFKWGVKVVLGAVFAALLASVLNSHL